MELRSSVVNMFFPQSKKPDYPDGMQLAPKQRLEVPPNRKVLVAWTAPSRVYAPKTKMFYRRVASIVFIVGVLLVLLGQFLFLAALVSLVVLYYVLSSVPPETVRHELDNYGVNCFGKQYYWEEFKYFFITEQSDHVLLHIDMYDPLPGRLSLIIDNDNKEKILNILKERVAMRVQPVETVFDKAMRKIVTNLSLE